MNSSPTSPNKKDVLDFQSTIFIIIKFQPFMFHNFELKLIRLKNNNTNNIIKKLQYYFNYIATELKF